VNDIMMRDFRAKEDEHISMHELTEGQKPRTIQYHSNLREAVERGDWHSVGQAAVIMSRDLNSNESPDSPLDKAHPIFLEKEERIQQLDALIDRGDWMGIVTLAGQYQALDKDLDSDIEPEDKTNDINLEAQAQTFLKTAIERGDWHAVGQAAAIIAKDSMPDKCTDSSGSASSAGTYSSQHTLYLEKEDRIKQLSALIDRGDWIGIVIAAGQYQAMDEDLDIKP
jgi:hypothetical protein